jgi:hypothetical protein
MTIPPHTPRQLFEMGSLLVTIVAAAAIAGARYRQLPPSLRYLAWLAWFELPLELWGSYLGFMKRNNLFIMPFYTVGELALLALVYSRVLQSATFRRAMPWLVGGFAAYTLADCLLAPDLTWFKPGQQVLQSLLLLGTAALYFRKLLRELAIRRLEHEPMFWVSLGLLLYFSGYLQIALFSNYMLKNYSLELNRSIWTIHYVLALVLHGCYGAALAMRPRPGQLSAPGRLAPAATALAACSR